MNPDNPFSSGPGKPAPKTDVSVAEPVPEEPAIDPVADEVVAEPVSVVSNVKPVASGDGNEPPPLEMEETSCRTCQFFHFEEDARVSAEEGECRYNAPTPGLDERAQWPVVDWNAWCGQWNSGISNDDMVKMARVVAERMTDPGSFAE